LAAATAKKEAEEAEAARLIALKEE